MQGNCQKACYRNLNKVDINESVLNIPRKDIERLDNEIRKVNWFEMVNDKDSNAASSELIKIFQQLVFKYSKGKKVKPKGKIPLPWLSDNLWKLMRTRDSAFKKSHKTGLTTDRLIHNGLKEIKSLNS